MTSPKENAIRALVVDDERLGRDVVVHMLQEHEDIELIGVCSTGKEALTIVGEQSPDLIFLDIKMPGMSGLELANCLKDDARPAIVFITAYNEFAVEAFDRNAMDYLLKPFDQERFDQMVDRVRCRFKQEEDALFARRLKGFLSSSPNLNSDANRPIDRIVVKESGRVFFVNPNDVDFFEASGNYVALNVSGKVHLVYDTLSRMEERLDSTKFLRIHRSTIVNLDRIKELQPHFNGEYVVILDSGTRLKLSRSYKVEARSRLGLD